MSVAPRPRPRPMQPDDVEAVDGLSSRCFDDLTRRLDLPTPPSDEPSQEQIAASHRRLRHLLAAHAAGAWVIDGDDGPLAAALALRHEDFWGLSLLVVDPGAQGRGLGRAALQAAMTTGEGAGRGLILSSLDPRATRLYLGAGFAEHPGLRAFGRVNRDGLPHEPAGVRQAREDDRELAAAGGWWAADARGRRGYAIVVNNRLALLAAEDIDTARALLVRCLAEADADKEVAVPTLSGATRWAVEILRAAGLAVHPSGPFFTRGFDPPPLYLPNAAWL